MTDTCKAFLNLEQYYNSCPSNGILKNLPKRVGIQIFDYQLSIQRDLAHTLAYLKNFLEKRDYLDYVKHPFKIFIDSARNSNNLHEQKHDLPKIFQSVWITNPEFPSSIKLEQLENFLTQSRHFSEYEKIIWTNIDPVRFKELHSNIFDNHDVKIKNISTLKTNHRELLKLLTSPYKYIPATVLDKGTFNGVLIDLAKYLVMEVHGGILADFNFHFSSRFNKNILDKYDFIAKFVGSNFIENGFFSAKASHIIFTEVLDIMHSLLIETSDCGVNEYRGILLDSNSFDLFAYVYSMEPLFMAFLKYNNFANNVDTLMGAKKTFDIDISALKKEFPESEKYIAHERSFDKLDSNNFEDLNTYAESYYAMLKPVSLLQSVYCDRIDEELIGEDSHSLSWIEANITSNS